MLRIVWCGANGIINEHDYYIGITIYIIREFRGFLNFENLKFCKFRRLSVYELLKMVISGGKTDVAHESLRLIIS